MMRITDFSVRTKDIYQEIALTSGVSNVLSMVILSWAVHRECLLQEPQQSTTNPDHTKATTPGQVPDISMKTGTGKVVPGYNHILQTL